MFGFMDMIGNYEARKIKNTVINEATIDTVAVGDSHLPYETGISHYRYNNGGWIIVELYGSKEEAEIGHEKWVKRFKGKLPQKLKDVSSCGLSANTTYGRLDE